MKPKTKIGLSRHGFRFRFPFSGIRPVSPGIIIAILILGLLTVIAGCRNYYKLTHPTDPSVSTIGGYQLKGRTVFIISDSGVYKLNWMRTEGEVITGVAEPVSDYDIHLTKNPTGTARYTNNDKEFVKHVHLYVSGFSINEGMEISLPIEDLEKVAVYEKDVGKTALSWIAGGILLTIGLYVILIIAVLAVFIVTSCPFVYVSDGQQYEFVGEIYSGATLPQLERHDYLILPVSNIDHDTLKIKISNELREVQHTNLVELMVFDHQKGVDVFVDKYGNTHAVSDLQSPFEATNLAGIHVMDFVREKDGLAYTGDDPGIDLPLTDGLILTFDKPGLSDEARLVIRAKTSFMLNHQFNQYYNLFGRAYHRWYERQKKVPVEVLHQWFMDQNIPVSVYLEKNGQWEFVDYYHPAGPFMMKEDLMAIPLDGITSGPLRIKLEYGNYFWEVDYVGIDYSTGNELTAYTVPIHSAVNSLQEDVSQLLAVDDDSYYIQPETGCEAEICFLLPPLSNDARTFVLHTKGHYQIIRDPKGFPQRKQLQAFREPGHFNRFSNDNLQSLVQRMNVSK